MKTPRLYARNPMLSVALLVVAMVAAYFAGTLYGAHAEHGGDVLVWIAWVSGAVAVSGLAAAVALHMRKK